MYTIADVEKHNKGLSPKKKKQWVAVANSVLQRCIADGGSEATCAASAIRQANGVVANMINYNSSNSNYVVREEQFEGKKYLVVPVTMMVEGVHRGSHGPLYHPIEELGKYPASWDGIPVMIQHPQDNEGNFISANSPEVLASSQVGQVFNTHVQGDRLRGEVWLGYDKLQQVSLETFQNINETNPIEVSIGVFTDDENTQGDWNGEQYNAIARNHRPDHLALLPGGTGACSLEDGCGIRANQKKGGNESMDVNAVITGMEEKRKQLEMSVSEFYAVPRDPPSDSKLPIFDAEHVRKVLASYSQIDGLNSVEKAKAKGKILTACRKFNIDASSLSSNIQTDAFEILKSAKEIGMYDDSIVDNGEAGYMEKVNAVRSKVDSLDNNETVNFLQEVYDGYVIYEARNRNGGSKLLKQNYTVNADGTMSFDGTPVEVLRKVEYVNAHMNITRKVNNNKERSIMENSKCTPCVEKKVNDLIANKQLNFTEADKEWLQGLEESQLDRMVPKAINSNSEQKPVEVTKEMILNAMTADQKAALAFGEKQLKERRESMIKGIQDNTEKDTWKVEELNTMSEELLTKIYNSVKKEEMADYSIQPVGLRKVNVNSGSIEPLLPAGIELETSK